MSVMGLYLGTHTEVVGVEDDPSGDLRVYVGHRAKGIYALVYDDEAKAQVRRAWSNGLVRVIIPMPPADALQQDPEAPWANRS